MRVAVRDVNTGALGSASEFIEVPRLRPGHIALSSIILASGKSVMDEKTNAEQENGKARTDVAAVRSFRQGESIVYLYQVLNAHKDKERQTAVEAQVSLFRNGDAIFTTTPEPPKTDHTSTPERLLCGGALHLGQKMPPGDYVLLVAVRDGRNTRVTRAIDFEVK